VPSAKVRQPMQPSLIFISFFLTSAEVGAGTLT
jgi:hypothetical protein